MNDNLKSGLKRTGHILGRVALGAGLLLLGAMIGVGADRIIPRWPETAVNRPDSRAGWYLESGLWQADARTLFAAVRYVLTPEPDPEPHLLPVVSGPVAVMLEGRLPRVAAPDELQARTLAETPCVQRIF